MLGAKISLRKAEQVKNHILKKDLLNKDYSMIKDKNSVIFPVKKEFDNKNAEFGEFNFKKRGKKQNWKDALEEKLTEEEFEILKTAHDIVGSIAILEIPEELKKKEKIIAETLLSHNKNVKTVLKKAGEHEGTFRTQKMQWLAGDKTKETIHKENNVSIKVDIEKVFFTSRLSTERKRIMQQIKKDENILVMFSGCAPYVCVFAKNTEAKRVLGIELNPDGHKYGLENIKINKLHNVALINNDVRNSMPNIYKELIGLKCARLDEEMNSRMKENPKIMEFHLFEEDLFKDLPKLEKKIQELKKKGLDIILHMPFSKRTGSHFNFAQDNLKEELEMTSILGELCKKYDSKAIIHPSHSLSKKGQEKTLINNLRKLKPYYNYFYFENETEGLFAETESIIEISREAGFKNICIDTVHLYIVYEDNNKIEEHIRKVQKEFNTYFHLNDHDKKTHSCEIGTGFIDFSKVLPYVNEGIAEVRSKDEKIGAEIINSYRKLIDEIPKFDRISMQLPKTADEFMEQAFSVAKKGTIIHFYDFQYESDFDNVKVKIQKAADKAKLKIKFLDFVKCGQIAPSKFRVCQDFKII